MAPFHQAGTEAIDKSFNGSRISSLNHTALPRPICPAILFDSEIHVQTSGRDGGQQFPPRPKAERQLPLRRAVKVISLTRPR